jgi:hypothetical protein
MGPSKDPCLAPDDPRNLWQFFNKVEQNDKKKWRSECQCCGQKYWDLSPYKMLDHFGYPLTRETLLKFKPCSGIDKDEHKDVKATVQRIHAAEFAKKSALKLATAQGSRKLTESLRVNEFVTVEGRTFALGADEHRKIMKAVEARWDMLHSDLQSAAYILNPRYRHTHDFSGSAMQEHDALLQKWLSEDDLHTYKAEFGSYKEKTDIFSAQTIWTDKALEVDAHVWWDYWASGKKVLHDFATRVTSQPLEQVAISPSASLLCAQPSPARRRAIQAPARPNHQSCQRAPVDRWSSHGSCRRQLIRSSTKHGQTLSTNLRCRSTCWTIHQCAQRSTPPPIWYAHSGHSACRIV